MTSSFKVTLLLILLTFINYINILPNKLFFDDEELIYKNTYVSNIEYIPKFFSENMIAGAGKISNMYRPILMTTFSFDHLFWGNNPIGYHLTSILLHAGNGILIFFLIKNLFEQQILAFVTSILFIVHPIQTEAIAYASGRTDPLYVFFALSSMTIFLSLIKDRNINYLKWFGVIIFYLLSLLSKETAAIFPVIILLIYFVIYDRYKINLSRIIILISPLFLISGVYIYLRLTVLNFSNTLNFYSQNNVYSQNIMVRLYTFTRVFFEYLSVILFPVTLSVAREIPIITSPFNYYVILFIIIFIGAFLFAIKYFKKEKIFLFVILWFFITILPTTGIIPINNIISEHYLYFPSLAIFLLFAKSFSFLRNKFSKHLQKIFLVISLTIIFMLLITRTIIRTFDWRDPVTFYTKSLILSPGHIPMHNNLAMAYEESGKLDLAITEYKKTISLADVYPNTHHNLANVYKELGKYKDAEEEYQKALKMDPSFYFSYYGLTDLYQKTGNKEKFEDVLRIINQLKK